MIKYTVLRTRNTHKRAVHTPHWQLTGLLSGSQFKGDQPSSLNILFMD